MEIPDNLKYTNDHEWLDIDGSVITVGITDYAQKSLGDIVFIELPEVGMIVDEGETLGNIESVKAVSEIFCPVAGEVIEVNKDLEETPERINQTPYDDGWIVKLKIDPGELSQVNLLNDEQYESLVDSR
jgi:glycine cleavage system H protein